MTQKTDHRLDVLDQLIATIEARAAESTEKSYTASLLAKGADHCAKKFGEEAVEVIIAAMEEPCKNLILESADVLFHLLVLLKSRNIEWRDVMNELDRRTMQSGLQEKASRPSNQTRP